MLPLIVDEFDLALASTLGLGAMLAAGLPGLSGLPVWLTVFIVLAAGAVIGLVHATLIVGLGLPSFVVTLGSSSVIAGVILLYSGGTVLYQGIPPELSVIGTGNIGGLGLPVVYLLVITMVLWFLLSFRPIGRKLYATGANETAARLAGVPTARIRVAVLIVAPVIASFAGLVLTAKVGSANPTSYSSFFLPAFAAAFLSLAVFTLGRYNPWGVVFSVYLLAVGVAGLSQIGVPSWVDPVFNGAALILAIVLSRFAGDGVRVKTP
jgi:ribose transport system permease protein